MNVRVTGGNRAIWILEYWINKSYLYPGNYFVPTFFLMCWNQKHFSTKMKMMMMNQQQQQQKPIKMNIQHGCFPTHTHYDLNKPKKTTKSTNPTKHLFFFFFLEGKWASFQLFIFSCHVHFSWILIFFLYSFHFIFVFISLYIRFSFSRHIYMNGGAVVVVVGVRPKS